MSALRFHFHRIAIACRAVKELAAHAERRAAGAERSRKARSVRPLAKSEAEAIVGRELLAAVATAAERP
jgi:hypothetical protein